jgi:hypothetical protein
MDGERISRALARIEAAASRIEVAASQADLVAPARSLPDSELTDKYQALRTEAGVALAQIDRLIGSLEP